MTNAWKPPTRKQVLSSIGWALIAASCFSGWAQPSLRLVPLTPQEKTGIAQNVNRALLPKGAALYKVDPAQVFHLVNSGAVLLTVVPVVFTNSSASGLKSFSCGVYLLPVGGAAYFVDGTPGDSDLPIQCWKILAVRLVRNGTTNPDILVTGSDSLTSHNWKQDYVLSSKAGKPYTLAVDYKEAP